jgi:hypothetical protein
VKRVARSKRNLTLCFALLLIAMTASPVYDARAVGTAGGRFGALSASAASVTVTGINVTAPYDYANVGTTAFAVTATVHGPGNSSVPDGTPVNFTLADEADPTVAGLAGASITPSLNVPTINGSVTVTFTPPGVSYFDSPLHYDNLVVNYIRITATAGGAQGALMITIYKDYTPPPPVVCDPSNHTEYTMYGFQYRISALSMQTDAPAYTPGSTIVVSGAVAFDERDLDVDQNCPKPYPTYNEDWAPLAGSYEYTDAPITLTIMGTQYPLRYDGTFAAAFTLPSSAPLGNYTFPVTVTGPSSSDGTPTTATRSLSVMIQSSVNTASAAAPPCDSSDPTQYAAEGFWYTLMFPELQLNSTMRAPYVFDAQQLKRGDTIVIIGIVELQRSSVLVDLDCPAPYPTSYGKWVDGNQSMVTIAPISLDGQNVSAPLPVDAAGIFAVNLTLRADLVPGDHALQVSAGGPPRFEGTPTTTFKAITIISQANSSASPPQQGTPGTMTLPIFAVAFAVFAIIVIVLMRRKRSGEGASSSAR